MKNECPDLIMTSGGTGFATSDITPEAVLPLVWKRAGSLEGYLLMEAQKITPMACLSRGLIGVLENKKTMIVCLPGKPKAVSENMQILLKNGILVHAI